MKKKEQNYQPSPKEVLQELQAMEKTVRVNQLQERNEFREQQCSTGPKSSLGHEVNRIDFDAISNKFLDKYGFFFPEEEFSSWFYRNGNMDSDGNISVMDSVNGIMHLESRFSKFYEIAQPIQFMIWEILQGYMYDEYDIEEGDLRLVVRNKQIRDAFNEGYLEP